MIINSTGVTKSDLTDYLGFWTNKLREIFGNDFVIKKEMMETEAGQKLLKVLRMPAFQKEIARFSGNDYRDLGKVITEV